jgi:glycosyltransferase involved in cell wall biosynthesis
VAVHVERLRGLLSELGFEPEVLSVGPPEATDGVHAFALGRPYWPTHLGVLARVVGRGGVLHNHYSSLTMYPMAREDPQTRAAIESMLRFASFWRIRWVETVHDQTIIERFPESSIETRQLFLKAMSLAAKVIAIGDAMRDFLLTVGVPEGKIVVGQPLLPARHNGKSLSDRYLSFFADRSTVWITVGAFTPLYDFVTVATAFRRLLEVQPSAGLVIVSGNFAQDESYRAEVLSVLGDGSANVLFVEDVPNEDVIELLRASTVLIRGPRHESFGLSRVEAILAGTPVVATETGQTSFMTLYAHGDVDSLLDAIARARVLEPEQARQAATFYDVMASRNLEVILGVYRELGALGAASVVP